MDALSPMEKQLLLLLKEKEGKAKPEEIEMELVKVMNAASWLQSKGLVRMEERLIKEYELTKEGERFLKEGLPEKILITKYDGKNIEEIEKEMGKKEAAIAIGWAKRKGWCDILKKDGEKIVIATEKGKEEASREQEEEKALKLIKRGEAIDEKIASILKRR